MNWNIVFTGKDLNMIPDTEHIMLNEKINEIKAKLIKLINQYEATIVSV